MNHTSLYICLRAQKKNRSISAVLGDGAVPAKGMYGKQNARVALRLRQKQLLDSLSLSLSLSLSELKNIYYFST